MILLITSIVVILFLLIGLSIFYYFYVFVKKVVDVVEDAVEDAVEDEKPKLVLDYKKDKSEFLMLFNSAMSTLSDNAEDFNETFENSESDLDFLENIGKNFLPVLLYVKYIEDYKDEFYDLNLLKDLEYETDDLSQSLLIFASELYYKYPLKINQMLFPLS